MGKAAEYLADLHIHTCLSPCGESEMTPSAVAGMVMLAGCKVAAISDHNSTKNCRAFAKAAEELGILPVPAMELTTAEEIHILCLFPDLDTADVFGDYVRHRLPNIKNSSDYFGDQIIMDEDDNVVGTEDILLANAASIGVYDVCGLLSEIGGVGVPAHIDRPSFSLLANLGTADPSLGFDVYEISSHADPQALLALHPDLRGARYMKNSDAHSFAGLMGTPHPIYLSEFSVKGVIEAVKNGQLPGVFDGESSF